MIMLFMSIAGVRNVFSLGNVNPRFSDLAERGALISFFGNGHGDLRAA
jgi:hypothetical protein